LKKKKTLVQINKIDEFWNNAPSDWYDNEDDEIEDFKIKRGTKI